MLRKEDCEVCLNQFIEDTNYYMGDKIFNDHDEEIDTLRQLIKEHFELVEEYKDTRKELDCYYEMMSNPQPYKFEDLKVGL